MTQTTEPASALGTRSARSKPSRIGVMALAAFVCAPAGAMVRGQTAEAPPVSASVVVAQEVNEGRSFVGTIVPIRRSTVGSPVDERVVEFPVNEGDRVEEGEVLARLRTRTLEIQLNGAKAELEAKKQELAEMENGTRPEEIKKGRADLARAAALRDFAVARRARVENLVRNRNASPEELDEAISNAEAAEQAYRLAQAELELLEKGPRAEQIAQARAMVDAQQERVRLLEEQLDEHIIRAPFDGFVAAEHTEIGQWVSRGDPIIELVELDQVDVDVMVLEDYIPYIEVGTPARVRVEALRDETITGDVALIVPQADLRSRSFPVKVRLDNPTLPDGGVALKAGMLARATLPVGEPHPGLLVLKDAIVLGGPSPVVFVIERSSGDPEMGTVQPVPVQLGVAEGSLIEVRGELQAGQLVVIQGNERLRPGQPVRILNVIEDPGASPTEPSEPVARVSSGRGQTAPNGGQ